MKKLPPWDRLLKEMLWQQLAFVQGMEVLDFGSGEGVTAAHMASHNRVTAVEPSPEMLAYRDTGRDYTQLEGDVARVNAMPERSFDAVLCHNVLEYVEDKPAVLRALCRVLRPGGILSLCKHNRAGRVSQVDSFRQIAFFHHLILRKEG